jgi:hypothetical protein
MGFWDDVFGDVDKARDWWGNVQEPVKGEKKTGRKKPPEPGLPRETAEAIRKRRIEHEASKGPSFWDSLFGIEKPKPKPERKGWL